MLMVFQCIAVISRTLMIYLMVNNAFHDVGLSAFWVGVIAKNIAWKNLPVSHLFRVIRSESILLCV